MLSNSMQQFKNTKEICLEFSSGQVCLYMPTSNVKNFEMYSETQVPVKLKVDLYLSHFERETKGELGGGRGEGRETTVQVYCIKEEQK